MSDMERSKAHTTQSGTAQGAPQPRPRSPQLKQLEALIGRWITEGQTSAEAGEESAPIVASDVYEWAPGNHFVLHTAYGHVGDEPAGGIEIIGDDASGGGLSCHFFDSDGNTTTQTLTLRDSTWTWEGEAARCTAPLSPDGKTLTAHHERRDETGHWVPSMEVILRKLA
jgi:hypothetical protein